MKSSPSLAPAAVAAAATLAAAGCEQPTNTDECPLSPLSLTSSSRNLQAIVYALDDSEEGCQVTLRSIYDPVMSGSGDSLIRLQVSPADARDFFNPNSGDNFDVLRARALAWIEAALSATTPDESGGEARFSSMTGKNGVLSDAFNSLVQTEREKRLGDVISGKRTLDEVEAVSIRIEDHDFDRNGCGRDVVVSVEDGTFEFGLSFSHYFLPGTTMSVIYTGTPGFSRSIQRTLDIPEGSRITRDSRFYDSIRRRYGSRSPYEIPPSPRTWLDLNSTFVCPELWRESGLNEHMLRDSLLPSEEK